MVHKHVFDVAVSLVGMASSLQLTFPGGLHVYVLVLPGLRSAGTHYFFCDA